MRGCVWRVVLCQPALGGGRLPSGHSDGRKVENKCFCLPDLVSFKEERLGLAGCVCSQSRVFPFFPLELPVPGSPVPPVRAVGSSASGFIGMDGAVSFELG